MNPFNPTPNNYNKRNFHETLEIISPSLYKDKDYDLSGVAIPDTDQIINAHIKTAANLSSILFVSGYSDISSISQYFVKQNNLTNVTTQTFETRILNPLNVSLQDFDNKEDFLTYLSGTLIPKIRTNDPNLATNTSSLYGSTASATHDYLVDNLGWFYFLNNSGLGNLTYEPSSYVISQLSTLYLNNTLETLDGIIGLNRYVWYNYPTKTQISSKGLIPTKFLSGTGTYTSGTQQLEKLETLIEVLYSKAYMDRQDFKIRDSIDNYINGLGLITATDIVGPHTQLLKAFGYSIADVNNDIEKLESLYDIEDCPDELLKYLATLIGLDLIGPDPEKWRHQLRSAVDLYKRKGTSAGVQLAINTVIKNTGLNVSSNITETWESYIPFILWYALATESIYFKNLGTWTQELANQAGITNYDSVNLENNIKILVDYILLEANKKFPELFYFQKKQFDPQKYYVLDNLTGEIKDVFGFVTEPKPKKVYFQPNEALAFSIVDPPQQEFNAFTKSFHNGPLGRGLYLEENFDTSSLDPFDDTFRPTYLTSLGSSSFVFNYRGHSKFPMPPFEEIKYYSDCDVTDELKIFLVEKLKCFGVPNSFAEQVGTYIKQNTYDLLDTLSFRNGFLMFFSSMQNPPNYFSVLQNRDSLNNAIFSLWNGKSSHVFVNYNTSSFSFVSDDFTGGSRYALQSTADLLNKYLPAHAITKLTLEASSLSDNYIEKNTEFNSIDLNQQQTMYSVPSGVFAGLEISGLSMDTVSPGTNSGRGGLNTFSRNDVNSLNDALVSSTSYIIAPRRSLRRRNYKFVLPSETYYDRTGFNQPISFDPSVLERSMASSFGFLPLGYIPSSNSFYPVYNSIYPSSVWDGCNSLTSNKSYFGVDVSNTFPCRGLSAIGSDVKMPEIIDRHDKYVDRGQVDPIFNIMVNAKYEEAIQRASDLIYQNTTYTPDLYWFDHVQSIANSYINNLTVGTSSFSDYENFRFGKGLHLLFKDYKTYFNNSLAPYYFDDTGANIYSHTFGPILYNADFSIEGSAVSSTEGRYIASSIDTIVPIGFGGGSGVFSVCAVQNGYASGTYIASSADKMPIPKEGFFTQGSNGAEFRNPYILSGIEFVQTSGASPNNSFEILKLDSRNLNTNVSAYAYDKTFIRCFTTNGFPRLIFDLSSYGPTKNLFINDHEFKFTLLSQVADLRYQEYGSGRVGVWIHTNTLSSTDGKYYMWSWTPRNKWELINYNALSLEAIKNDLALSYSFGDPLRITDTTNTGTVLNCLGNENPEVDNDNFASNQDPIINLDSKYLKSFEFNFNTKNYTNYNNKEYLQIIPIPEVYNKIKTQVHTSSTNYFVEIFYYPAVNENKYLLIDTISIQDLTLKNNAGIPTGYGVETSGIPLTQFSEEYKYFLSKEELQTVLKFFNGLTTNVYTTRNSTISSPVLDTSGGSRLNYRLHPNLVTKAFDGAAIQVTSIDFTN